MEVHTQSHLRQLRELLEYRLAELRADVAAATQVHVREDPREVGDRKDVADRERESLRDAAEEARDRVEMDGVAAAIARLDTGVYGDCVDCGEPIVFERLFVQPAAVRCAPCQAKHEQELPHRHSQRS